MAMNDLFYPGCRRQQDKISVLLQIKGALLCSCCCQSKLSLSTLLKPILILSQGDLFLYGTETMICQLKRQGWRSGFGDGQGVRR